MNFINSLIELCENGMAKEMPTQEIPVKLFSELEQKLREKLLKGQISEYFFRHDVDYALKEFFQKTTISYKDFYMFYTLYFSDRRIDSKEVFHDGKAIVNYVLEEIQKKDFEKIIPFPIRKFNEIFGGIFPTTFTVIGADTGCGKSELLGAIAFFAMEEKNRVAYFDFENDDGDFVMRQIAKKVSLKRDVVFTVKDLRLHDPENGEFADDIYGASEEVYSVVHDRLLIYNNEKIPTIKDFLRYLKMVIEEKLNVTLVIIDHLHYFQMTEGESQANQIANIMRELRLITKKRIPIFIASHLKQRLGNKKPTNYDLFGSSTIAKEAKNVILLSRDKEGTLIDITKNHDGQKIVELAAKFDPKERMFEFDPIYYGKNYF